MKREKQKEIIMKRIHLEQTTIIGYYGEPKAPAYCAKGISFYSRLFLFPFSVKWSETQRSYKLIKFNLWQKGLFACFVFGNVLSFLYWITHSVREIEMLSKDGEPITAGVLVTVCLLLTWLSVVTALVIIWIRQREMVEFLQSLQDSLEVLHLPSATVWLCPVLFYFASSLTNLSSTTGQITVSEGSKMVTDGIICVLKRLGLIPDSGIPWKANGLIFRGIVKSLDAFFKLIIFHGGCFCSMPHTILLTVALGMRQLGKEVKRTMETSNVGVAHGLRIYDKVKSISNKANSVFGEIMLTHYLCNLTYAIQTPFLFSEMGQLVEDVNYLLWLIVSAAIWWAGSESHRLLQEAFKNWIQNSLSRDMELDERMKLSILSNAVEKDCIGLYCRYFTVTHRFLTTTCGAVITYGIIVLQVQMQPVVVCRDSENI